MDLEQIKAIDCQRIADKLGLKKSGKNYHCFNHHAHKHKDQNPSLSISDKFFHCFGCGIAGDQIELVKNVLNIDFKSTCQWFTDQFNIANINTFISQSGTRQYKNPYIISKNKLPSFVEPPRPSKFNSFDKYYLFKID